MFASDVPLATLQLTRDIGSRSPLEARRSFDLFALGDLTGRLADVAVPVTVLSGLEDPATPVREAAALANAIKDSRLRLLPETAHLLPLERPHEIAEEIARLLDRTAATA